MMCGHFANSLRRAAKNVEQMLGGRIDDAIVYGTVSLDSPRQQETTMYVGSHSDFKVWLNGTLIYKALREHWNEGYTDFLPVTLQEGRNVLLVAFNAHYNAFFGFEPGTEYTVANPGVGYTFSKTPIHIDDTFTLDIQCQKCLPTWQVGSLISPSILLPLKPST